MTDVVEHASSGSENTLPANVVEIHPSVAGKSGLEGVGLSIQDGPRQMQGISVESTDLVPTVDVEIVTSVASLSPTALHFRRDIPFDEWCAVGEQLKKIESGVQWWIGDWLRYGEHAYGETYTQAIEQTDLAYQTLANTVWVAGKIEPSRRRENLSFKHHAEVASLDPEEQEALLSEAEVRKWNSMELRTAVKTYKREKHIAGKITGTTTDIELVTDDPFGLDSWPSSDMIIVVPPFWHDYSGDMALEWAELAMYSLRDDGNIFVIADSERALQSSHAMREIGFKDQTTIVWNIVKDYGYEQRYFETHQLIVWGGRPTVRLESIAEYTRSVWNHPPAHDASEPPGQLIEGLIDLATEPGQMIVDPFAGMGAVAVAAKKLHRNYWGAQPDGELYDIARRRTGGAIS